MLTSIEIENLEEKAEYIRRGKEIGVKSPIGKDIFNIIENYYDSYLLMYPLKSKNIAGFTRKSKENIQVFINTSLDKLYQNFVAAHELYHLISFKEDYKSNDFILCNQSDVCEELEVLSNKKEELEANYFAAAFLLPRKIINDRFVNKLKKFNSDEDYILEIIKIQYEYQVPYKTVIKRLRELEIIKEDQYIKFKSYENNINKYYQMVDSLIANNLNEMVNPSYRKYHTLNIPKLASDAYKMNLITFSKAQYQIEKYDKKTYQFEIEENIVEPIDFDFSLFVAEDEESYE